VPVRGEGATFAHGNPEVLFDNEGYIPGQNGHSYDMSPDGSRFLMIKINSVEDTATVPEIVVVENWFQETARAPSGAVASASQTRNRSRRLLRHRQDRRGRYRRRVSGARHKARPRRAAEGAAAGIHGRPRYALLNSGWTFDFT